MRNQFSKEERVTIRMRIEQMYGEGFEDCASGDSESVR